MKIAKMAWLALVGIAFAGMAANGDGKPLLAFNEDNDHYFYLPAEKMTEAALEAYVDSLAKGKVTHFVMCASGQRTSYDSKAWEPVWTGIGEPDERGKTNNAWRTNAKALADKGIDPYEVWTRRAREKGISPWMSIRMNDVHHCGITNYYRNTTFWRSRPELRTKPYCVKGDWLDYTLDYAHADVREYTMKLVAEHLERWDVDGLELDWMRFPRHLQRGREKENAHFITEFVAEAKKLADAQSAKRGRKVRLGARVPATPELAMALGLDVADWVKKGYVDWVVASCFFVSNDQEIDLEGWRRSFGEKAGDVTLLPGADMGWAAYPAGARVPPDCALLSGWADLNYARGAEGVYLFNLQYAPAPLRDGILQRGLGLDAVKAFPMSRYPVAFRDVSPEWKDNRVQLPVTTRGRRVLLANVGPVGAGRRCAVVAGISEAGDARFALKMNGVEPTGRKALKDGLWRWKKAGKSFVEFEFPAGTVRAGVNEVEIVPTHPKAQEVTWLEIFARGK